MTTASAVSAVLRRGGLLPYSGPRSRRTGLRVSGQNPVRVTADFDGERQSARLASAAADILAAAGYEVERIDPAVLWIHGKA